MVLNNSNNTLYKTIDNYRSIAPFGTWLWNIDSGSDNQKNSLQGASLS